MLRERALVVSNLDLQTHRIQRLHEFSADAHSLVIGRKIKIPAHVMGYGMDRSLAIAAKQEELGFRTHIEGHSPFG